MAANASSSCHFCQRSPAEKSALTVRGADYRGLPARRSETLLVCPRCVRAIARAREGGRVFKRTQERWWLGHGKPAVALRQ